MRYLKKIAFFTLLTTCTLFMDTSQNSFIASENIGSALIPYTATYFVRYSRFKAYAYISLKQPEGKNYLSYQSITSPSGRAKLYGRIIEKSSFSVNNDEIQPRKYDFISRKPNSINFNWEIMQAEMRNLSDVKEQALLGHELDLISLQFKLSMDIRASNLHEKYTILNKNSIFDYHIEDKGTETLQILNKTIQTNKLKQHRDGSSRYTLLWFSPEFDGHLVKVEHYKNDKLNGTMLLTAYQYDDE